MPYFFAVMSSFQAMKKPALEDIPRWMFISADMVEQTQVMSFIHQNSILKEYHMDLADYRPAKNERMGDYSANNSKAVDRVYLTFLRDKSRVEAQLPRLAY
jgi:hypothetical protein